MSKSLCTVLVALTISWYVYTQTLGVFDIDAHISCSPCRETNRNQVSIVCVCSAVCHGCSFVYCVCLLCMCVVCLLCMCIVYVYCVCLLCMSIVYVCCVCLLCMCIVDLGFAPALSEWGLVSDIVIEWSTLSTPHPSHSKHCTPPHPSTEQTKPFW